ncbi:MAG: patatin family protein [Lachnospiraceae bacterium]|nr:patatin family protein [Lachnospiraceae bacterium]
MALKAGLILEGGSNRGVFTSGVLDYFMEQNCYIPNVAGVSAGSCNLLGYVSQQQGRTKRCMIDFLRAGQYAGVRYIVKQKSIFDMDLIFDIFPNAVIPFDYKTYFQSRQKSWLVTTNCQTGKAEYLDERADKKRLMSICRASCSIPIVSPTVEVDGIPMLDGGMADSIPLRFMVKQGCNRNVLILTRQKGYRKSPSRRNNRVSTFLYGRKYPNLVRTIKRRYLMYNRTMELIERLEEEGKIFVIRPQVPVISSMEHDPEILQKFYDHGYSYAAELYPAMMEFLKGCEIYDG